MAKVIVQDGDLEGAIAKFKRFCKNDGIIKDCRKNDHFIPEHEKRRQRKRRVEARRKRALIRQAECRRTAENRDRGSYAKQR